VIDAYSFGCMTIAGRQYHKDLIIRADGTVFCPWWRNRGHGLSIDGLREALEPEPEIVVVGTGSPGMMQPDKDLSRVLRKRGIEPLIMPTAAAAEEYNRLRADAGRAVAACFHLTC
jgi:hypothetical protein